MMTKYYLRLLVPTIIAISFTSGFVVSNSRKYTKPSKTSLQDTQSSGSLFESEVWNIIKKDLNKVPIFAVATEEGHPLAYKVEISGEAYNVPCFYCDCDAALTELEQVKSGANSEGFDIIPFPLGQAFELWADDKAVIVPSKQSILQAGAPPETNPIGQQVPLFACMEIAEQDENGKSKLPVFMSLDDANSALQQAVEADGGKVEDFEVVCLSLKGCIEQLATVPDTPAFHFIPPSKSMKYIQDYLK